MNRTRLIATATLSAGLVAIGGAAAASSGADDDGPSITGSAAEEATAAALEATGGGTANSVERDSENGATWEVEVTRPDGQTVDVRLDDRFGVVVIEGDSEVQDTGSDQG